ncbi:hypothetical protein L1987_02167 [Smallanthus sonchifolius]|uniref:Uncharacterized protein n=1 Tax=Smallanthus sonchifolius TaxID=185202 RepID=A0ACB9K790_9ASTR|nr:hypothetical protein L1987_02167 [Smallanthus sonchifolius]
MGRHFGDSETHTSRVEGLEREVLCIKENVIPVEMSYRLSIEVVVDSTHQLSVFEKSLEYKILTERLAEIQVILEGALVGVRMSGIWSQLDRVLAVVSKGKCAYVALQSLFYSLNEFVMCSHIRIDPGSPDILSQFEGNFLHPYFEEEGKDLPKKDSPPVTVDAKPVTSLCLVQVIPVTFIRAYSTLHPADAEKMGESNASQSTPEQWNPAHANMAYAPNWFIKQGSLLIDPAMCLKRKQKGGFVKKKDEVREQELEKECARVASQL